MPCLFLVLAMIYPLMTYGANVEYSLRISKLPSRACTFNIYNRIALVLGILSGLYGGLL